MFSVESATYKIHRRSKHGRKIYALPRPFLMVATPHKQVDFSNVTRDAVGYISSSLSMSKAIFVGDVAVGKTSLVNRFCHRIFETNYKATIGVDFEVERFEILDVNFNLQIWDTAGQERFKCIAQSYYRGAHAIILLFSLCDPSSLKHAHKWLHEALKMNNGDPLIFLVGTKRDKVISSSYMTMESEAVKVAKELNAEYWSVSAKTGDCVNHFFNRLAALTFDKIMHESFEQKSEKPEIGNPFTLIKNNTIIEKKGCISSCKS